MDPRKLFADQRLSGHCIYCWSPSDSSEHVPSRILLDEPYPENLPVVEACGKCNSGFSMDEEYLACLIECVVSGTTNPAGLTRPKISKILFNKPRLKSSVDSNRYETNGNIMWKPDNQRVLNVISKLARGHVAYENSEPPLGKPAKVLITPLYEMSEQDRLSFETPLVSNIFPEIGSRGFMKSFVVQQNAFIGGWQTVQENRYRYCVSYSERITVRMVLSDYLGCEVVWE